MIFILYVLPAVLFGIGQLAEIPATADGDQVLIVVVTDDVIHPVEDIPALFGGHTLVAVGGLVQQIVGCDPLAQFRLDVGVMLGNIVPQIHNGVYISFIIPEFAALIGHTGVLVAILAAGRAVEVQDHIQLMLRGTFNEPVQELEGDPFVLTGQVFVEDVQVVEGETDAVHAKLLFDDLKILFGKEGFSIHHQQAVDVMDIQIGIGFDGVAEILFAKFRILHVAVGIGDIGAIRIGQRFCGKGAHPAFLQHDLAGIDALQLNGLAVGIVECAAVSLD